MTGCGDALLFIGLDFSSSLEGTGTPDLRCVNEGYRKGEKKRVRVHAKHSFRFRTLMRNKLLISLPVDSLTYEQGAIFPFPANFRKPK